MACELGHLEKNQGLIREAMPYKLRKAPKKELYWVVNKDTGKKHSKDPLPKERAMAQMRALYASEAGYEMTGGIKIDPEVLLGSAPMGSPTSPLSPTDRPAEELAAMRARTGLSGEGRGGSIHKSILQQMAQSAYAGKTKKEIGPYQLVYATPTLKFYKKPNEHLVIVAIRGTADKEDVDADIKGLTGNLRSSDRWKRDRATMEFVQKTYPLSEYRFIGVGHSLGGAILDLMLRDGLISSGMSYNPYVEPQEMGGNPAHHRIYHKDDPLYKWFGHKIPNVEVRTTAEPIWKYYLKSYLPAPIGHLFQMYDRHRVRVFKGGAIQPNFRKQLMELGIEPEDYLEQVKKSAERTGYDVSKIDFSDNKTHKIRIERPDGKIVRFGRVGYNDFHIWSHLERNTQVSKGTAKEKQDRFWKSHSKIKGDWKGDKYSPNWLSMRLLW